MSLPSTSLGPQVSFIFCSFHLLVTKKFFRLRSMLLSPHYSIQLRMLDPPTAYAARMIFFFVSFISYFFMLRDTKRHQQRRLAVGKFTIIVTVCVFSFTNNIMMFLDFHRHTSSRITTTTDPTSSGCPPTRMTTERVRDGDGEW